MRQQGSSRLYGESTGVPFLIKSNGLVILAPGGPARLVFFPIPHHKDRFAYRDRRYLTLVSLMRLNM